MDQLSLRDKKLARWSALKTERSSWDSRYLEISEYLLPYSGRFQASDRNMGNKNFNSILDETATFALGVLAAGMMAGMTSPARPWFRLATPDPKLMEHEGVKFWLNDVSQLMRDIFARSNTYRSLHTMYEELGSFATAVNIIDDDYDTVIWNTALTAGEYAIATDAKGRPNTVYYEAEMTVAQIVEEFVYGGNQANKPDWDKVSHHIKNKWDTGKGYDSWWPILRVIEPRLLAERDYSKYGGSRNKLAMPWRSCYFELGQEKHDKVLRESGYREFPVLGPRWHTRGRDIYGNGPSFMALGSIKQLQHEQLRKGQAIDFLSNPPVALPGEMKGREVDALPGGVTFLGVGSSAGSRGHNLYDIKIDLQHLLLDIQDVRQRINRSFYADLFLNLSNQPITGRQITAREIAERHEEKLVQLGPVLERLHDEMLSPLIDTTFMKMIEAGILPPAPEEMQGQDLKVEFVSTLAQAQRMVGLGSVDRLIGTVAVIAPFKPDILDKIDADQLVDKYAEMLAVDPSLIVADEKIAIIRADRAKQQAAATAAAMAKPAADAAGAVKTMSEVDQDGLNDIMQNLTGYTTQ